MTCPKCKSNIIFYFKHKPLVRNRHHKIIGTLPQYQCITCGCKWDIDIKDKMD